MDSLKRAAWVTCFLVTGTALGADTAVVSEVEDTAEAVAAPVAAPDDGVGPVKPVLVVNTRPIPVTGQVTGNVAVTGEVTIGNVVRIVEAARQPFNEHGLLSMPEGTVLSSVTIFTVPAGKQLVVTHASIRMLEGSRMTFIVQALVDGIAIIAHPLLPVTSGPFASGSPNTLVASQPLEMILRPGSELTCSVIRESDEGGISGVCNVSGYFEDLSNEPLGILE